MRGIKHVLTERFYAWEDAVKLAEQDPEVDLTGNSTPYTPSEFLEEELADEFVEEEAAEEEIRAEEEVKEAQQAPVPEADPTAQPTPKVPGDAPRI